MEGMEARDSASNAPQPHRLQTWLASRNLALLVIFLGMVFLRWRSQPGLLRGEIEVDGLRREYLVYVPPSYDPTAPAPLIISIHGLASWPENQMFISQWNVLADERGLIVAYPAGTGSIRRWNAGRTTNPGESQKEVHFISALIDRLAQEYQLDPARIYVNGLSNGGGMAYLLACSLADRIAAIGSVAGAYLYSPADCQPARPVPLIAFHGTADPIVPYAGGPTFPFQFEFPSVAEWMSAWAERNGCTSLPTELPAVGEVSGVRYTGCTENAEVIFYTVHGGGHTWPGGGYLPKIITGSQNNDIDATALMWEFFTRHPLADP